MWLVNLISIAVFAAFLARETLTVALGMVPSASWLWRMSFDFGYDLIPFLHILSDGFRLGVFGTMSALVTIIALIAAGAVKRDPRAALLGIHAATIALGVCWLADNGNFARLSSIAAWKEPDRLVFMSADSIGPMTPLLGILLIACVYAHLRYLSAMRQSPMKRTISAG